MPIHVPLLIEVQETPLSKIMQSPQFRYTRHYNLKYRTWGHLFQGRYKAILCEKDPYFLELSAYIHLNPVQAGLGEDPLDYPWSIYKAYASGAVEDLLDQRALLAHFSKIPSRARRELVRLVKSRMGQRHTLKSIVEHFGRDPPAISQGVGKLETRLREDENLGNRITEPAEKLAKGRKRILI